MEFEELFTKLKMDPKHLIETLVCAKDQSVILFKNTKSEIIYVNEQFYKKHPQFTDCRDDVIGKTDFDLFPGSDHAKQAYEDEQKVMQTGKSINLIETEGKDSQGRTMIAHTRKYPLKDANGKVVGVFVITEDMTSDVATLRKNQEKAKLLTQLNIELSQENATDTLSQLYNRRFIHAELDRLQDEYVSKGTPYSLILMDLDHFKSINDTYGHSIGDEVIRYIGSVLNNIKRQRYPSMEGCRYGGDEFLVILPAYEKAGAVSIAKDIKEAFDNSTLHVGKLNQKISVSMGVAGIKDDETIEVVLNRCDQRLYHAKNSGRNQIGV